MYAGVNAKGAIFDCPFVPYALQMHQWFGLPRFQMIKPPERPTWEIDQGPDLIPLALWFLRQQGQSPESDRILRFSSLSRHK